VQFPVRVHDSKKLVQVEFLSRGLTDEDVERWTQALEPGSNAEQFDAVELIESALAKCVLARQKGRFVKSVREILAKLRENQRAELLGVFSVSAPWLLGGQTAAFCQFRRTWCNHVVFDFLSVHPRLLGPRPREVTGLGTALLARLSLLVAELKVPMVWAETTDLSVGYYAGLFDLQNLGDLLTLDAKGFEHRFKTLIAGQHGKR
jgi:hypothetical protein